MHPQERFYTALAGGIPDEVPVSLSIGPSNAKRWIGKSDALAVCEAHNLVGSIPTYGYKGNPTLKPRWKTGWDETIQTQIVDNKENYHLSLRTITTPYGTLTSVERIDRPEYDAGQIIEPLIKTREDYKIYLAYIEEWLNSVLEVESEEITELEDEIGREGVWVWWIHHTFYEFFWALRRVEDYLLDFYDAPDLMKMVVEKAESINKRYLQLFNKSRCRVLITNISGASTSIVSPTFFKEWILPELKWLVAGAKKDKLIGFHSTGKIRDILPLMLEAKPHFVLRFESPTFGGDISLAEAKSLYGDKVCLMGGYDPQVYLSENIKEITKETVRCINEAAEGGSYVLDNTDTIPEETKVEYVQAMTQVVKEFGKY